MIKISVIVPVYNVEKYIDECLSSICSSTLKEIEILLIDDGSTDHSGNICEEWKKKDNRIKVYHKSNGGLSDARNFGIKMAKGEYISFVDSDDKISEHMLEILYKACIREKTLVAICGIYLWNPELKKTKNVRDLPLSGKVSLNYLKLSEMYHNTAWRKLYHKSLFNDEHSSFPLGRIHEDIGFWWIIMSKVDNISIVNIPLYYYRQNNLTSICAEKNVQKHCNDTLFSYMYGLNNGLPQIADKYKIEYLQSWSIQYLKNTTLDNISSDIFELDDQAMNNIKNVVKRLPEEIKQLYYARKQKKQAAFLHISFFSDIKSIINVKIRFFDKDIVHLGIGNV